MRAESLQSGPNRREVRDGPPLPAGAGAWPDRDLFAGGDDGTRELGVKFVLVDRICELHKGRRIVAVFQAHQYQRINGFFDKFAEALAQAPRVLIARTYAARESGIVPGEPEERLAKELRRRGVECMAYGDFAGINADLSLKTARNDAVIFIGAGNINQVAYDILKHSSIVSARFDAIRPAELTPAEDAA